MSDAIEKFRRYLQIHSLLHAPEALQSSVELAPVELSAMLQTPTVKHKGRKKAKWAKLKSLKRVPTLHEHPQPWTESSAMELLELLRQGSLKFAPREEPRDLPSPLDSNTEDSIILQRFEHEGPPQITFAPPSFECSVALFQDQRFVLSAPKAQKVELVWHSLSEGWAARAIMDNTHADDFAVVIGIEDGEYLFGFEVDGHFRPDTDYAQRIALRGDGLFARRKLTRYVQTCALRNEGPTEELVVMESDAAWLVPETSLRLQPGVPVIASLRLIPVLMNLGKNEAILKAQALRNDGMVTVAEIPFVALAEAGGALPEFQFSPSELGWILQGHENPSLNVRVDARGQGSLAGMVIMPYTNEVVDFQLEPESERRTFSRSFIIDSANLPYRARGMLKLKLITDSYLANYRLIQADVPYSLTYLQKSLPALAFGKIRRGFTRTMRLEVLRSDAAEIDLEASVPASIAPYVEAIRARQNAYSFRFDTRELQPGTMIDEMITLIDRASGLRDHIKILAEVVSYQADEMTSAAANPARR